MPNRYAAWPGRPADGELAAFVVDSERRHRTRDPAVHPLSLVSHNEHRRFTLRPFPLFVQDLTRGNTDLLEAILRELAGIPKMVVETAGVDAGFVGILLMQIHTVRPSPRSIARLSTRDGHFYVACHEIATGTDLPVRHQSPTVTATLTPTSVAIRSLAAAIGHTVHRADPAH